MQEKEKEIVFTKFALKIEEFDLSEIKKYFKSGVLIYFYYSSYSIYSIRELLERSKEQGYSEGYNLIIEKEKGKEVYRLHLDYFMNSTDFDKLRGWNRLNRFSNVELDRVNKLGETITTNICNIINDINDALLKSSFNRLGTCDYPRYYLKKKKYQFKDAKLSKDAGTISFKTKEFGLLPISTCYLTCGIKGFLNQLNDLFLNDSEEIDNLRKKIEKSIELDICIITITNSRSSTEINIYDSKGRRKVISGYTRYYGIKFFENFDSEYIRSKKFYSISNDYGIFSFDIKKVIENGLLRKIQGKYVVDQTIPIDNFNDFKQKYIDLVGEEEASARLLMLEVQ